MKISVIVPCRNEEDNIKECIDAIFSSETIHQLEVIVVDGMSTDSTPQIIKELAQDHYPELKLVDNPQKVTPVAFNIGIKASSGDYVQIIGARQVISPNYLNDAVNILETKKDIWCVGGAVENVYMSDQSRVIGLAMASSFGVGGGNFRILKESTYVDTVGTPMYPSWVFDKIGVFNEVLVRNQDDELNYRLTKAGGKIWLGIEMRIKYYVRASISKLFKQYYQYGYWKVYVNKMHHTITTIRQLVPLFFVLGLLIGLILSIFIPYFIYVYAIGIGLYAILSLIFGFRVAKKIGQGIKVALVFPILHFSYGWGYLVGLFDFFILNKKPGDRATQLTR